MYFISVWICTTKFYFVFFFFCIFRHFYVLRTFSKHFTLVFVSISNLKIFSSENEKDHGFFFRSLFGWLLKFDFCAYISVIFPQLLFYIKIYNRNCMINKKLKRRWLHNFFFISLCVFLAKNKFLLGHLLLHFLRFFLVKNEYFYGQFCRLKKGINLRALLVFDAILIDYHRRYQLKSDRGQATHQQHIFPTKEVSSFFLT